MVDELGWNGLGWLTRAYGDHVPSQSLAEPNPKYGDPWPNRQVLYSVRVPKHPGKVECGFCELPFNATGPTGYADSRKICDLCLLEGSNDLGMLLALAAVTRAFGCLELSSRQESRDALVELGAFARIYERFAARSGPPRGFHLPGDPKNR
jgi:hypothetical protein